MVMATRTMALRRRCIAAGTIALIGSIAVAAAGTVAFIRSVAVAAAGTVAIV